MNQNELTPTYVCSKCQRPCEWTLDSGRVASMCCNARITEAEPAQIMHTLVKCATPSCQNGVRASKGPYCPDCQKRHEATIPEAR